MNYLEEMSLGELRQRVRYLRSDLAKAHKNRWNMDEYECYSEYSDDVFRIEYRLTEALNEISCRMGSPVSRCEAIGNFLQHA